MNLLTLYMTTGPARNLCVRPGNSARRSNQIPLPEPAIWQGGVSRYILRRLFTRSMTMVALSTSPFV